jgi:ADP-ribose pyrophosphatase
MTPHGPWTIVRSATAYRDPWVDVRRDEVIRPDGRPGTHVVVRILAGVSVLAVDDAEHVHLTDEFHYAVGRHSLEVVSGGLDAGETPLEGARRELREELGLTARDWLDLGETDPFTSTVVSPTRLFLARGLSQGEATPEGTEQIRRVRIPAREAVAMVLDGRISHAPSGLLILKAARVLGW